MYLREKSDGQTVPYMYIYIMYKLMATERKEGLSLSGTSVNNLPLVSSGCIHKQVKCTSELHIYIFQSLVTRFLKRWLKSMRKNFVSCKGIVYKAQNSHLFPKVIKDWILCMNAEKTFPSWNSRKRVRWANILKDKLNVTSNRCKKPEFGNRMQCNKMPVQASLSQKALSACACFQLGARKKMDKSLKITYLIFITVQRNLSNSIIYVLNEN